MRFENNQDQYRARTDFPPSALPADILPEPTPVWMAALIAARCHASANGQQRAVRWNHVRGRALYTNARAGVEFIQPLGIELEGGHTMAVSWIPGDTAYTVEVYRQYDVCA